MTVSPIRPGGIIGDPRLILAEITRLLGEAQRRYGRKQGAIPTPLFNVDASYVEDVLIGFGGMYWTGSTLPSLDVDFVVTHYRVWLTDTVGRTADHACAIYEVQKDSVAGSRALRFTPVRGSHAVASSVLPANVFTSCPLVLPAPITLKAGISYVIMSCVDTGGAGNTYVRAKILNGLAYDVDNTAAQQDTPPPAFTLPATPPTARLASGHAWSDNTLPVAAVTLYGPAAPIAQGIY